MNGVSEFHAGAPHAGVHGWVGGTGPRVVLVHGGPGLSNYLEGLRGELDGYRVASYQQRGLAPSRPDGPFTVTDHLADLAAVLDELGWARAVLVGHSWGGHLALHAAVAIPDRVDAVLAVDPLGAVGDGGAAEFEAEISRRLPPDIRGRAEELDERAMRGEGTEADAVEGLRLVWPAYFPSWEVAPAMPAMSISVACYAETFESLKRELPSLEASMPSLALPVGFLVGSKSPIPVTASTDTAGRIPGAWVQQLPSAGHFPWLDESGAVASALRRLMTETGS